MKARNWLSRRALIRASTCLLLGALINVAVAWGCVCWSPIEDNSETRAGGWARPVPADWPAKWVQVNSERGVGLTIDHCSSGSFQPHQIQWVLSAGWPLPSLVCERRLVEEHLGAFFGAVELLKPRNWTEGLYIPSWLRPRNLGIARFLPAQPLWSGFVIDTLLYASIPWCIALGFERWRRRRCIRLHLCPKCGYDLRGAAHAVCPECGSPITP